MKRMSSLGFFKRKTNGKQKMEIHGLLSIHSDTQILVKLLMRINEYESLCLFTVGPEL